MFIRKCMSMKTDFKIQTYETKLDKISSEIDILAGQITDAIEEGKDAPLAEICEQLREIQDFVNS